MRLCSGCASGVDAVTVDTPAGGPAPPATVPNTAKWNIYVYNSSPLTVSPAWACQCSKPPVPLCSMTGHGLSVLPAFLASSCPACAPVPQVTIFQSGAGYLTACTDCIPGGVKSDEVKPFSSFQGPASIWEVLYDPNHPNTLAFSNTSTGRLLSRCDGCGGGSTNSVTAHPTAQCIQPAEQGGDTDGCMFARWTVVPL